MVNKVIFGERRKAQHYVVDLKKLLRITDTKKASTVPEETFLCDRLLENKPSTQFGYNSSGLFVHTQ